MDISIAQLSDKISKQIASLQYGLEPQELYEPIRYIMQLGGKRLRPMLTLLATSLYSDNVDAALKPAAGVEVFHNFTLMHDDIMDQAPLRRGLPTVHEKWNANVAILSGDVMLVKAYELFLEVEPAYLKNVLQLFSKCAAEVCEGQQFDMNFEKLEVVKEEEYINMIRLKTAVLLGLALEVGALIAGASQQDQVLLREFGTSIGIGFQLKDDLLDVYGEQAKFGKQVGGDIIANKKTFLLINAINLAGGTEKEALQNWLSAKEFDKEEKVKAVTAIYNKLGIKELTEQKMNEYFAKGFAALDKVSVADERKHLLRQFATELISRES